MRKNFRAALGVKILLVVVLGVFFFTGVYAKPAWSQSKKSKPIVLRAVTFLPTYLPLFAPLTETFIPKVNEAFGGDLTIKLLGGPEVIRDLDQVEAVRSGMVEMVFVAAGDYTHLVPEADAITYTEYAPEEERERGIYDYWVDVHKKANVLYLGKWLWGPRFLWHFRNKRINRIADLNGLKINDNGGDGIWLKEFGMVQVEVEGENIHTAMGRGIVDGFTWPNFTYFPGWEEQIKYILDEPFYEMNLVTLVNLEAWNKIPKEWQDKLLEIQATFERGIAASVAGKMAEEKQTMLDAGAEYIKLSPEESKLLSKTIKRATWDHMSKGLDPVTFDKLKKLITR